MSIQGYGTGIRNHNLSDMRILQLPLDQGSRSNFE